MSTEKRNQRKQKYDSERRDYIRDTVCAVIVLAVLVLAPIGITLYQNHKAAAANEAYMKQLEALLASASNASPSDALSTEESSADEGNADESGTGENSGSALSDGDADTDASAEAESSASQK